MVSGFGWPHWGRRLAVVLAVLAAIVLAGDAWAHKTSLSTSRIDVTADRISYRLTVSAHDLAVAMGIETDLVVPVPKSAFVARAAEIDRYLRSRIRILGDDRPCPAGPAVLDYGKLPDDIVVNLDFRCTASIRDVLISYLVFFDIDPKHRGVGVIEAGDGPQEFLVDPTVTEIEARRAPPVYERFLRFLVLGVEHIIIGYDHILFLLALLLASRRFIDLVAIVTAVTLAHSVTLSLAWFGVVDLPARLVESLIAASIIVVATGNLMARGEGGRDRRWLLAGGFGLVHGFGFYGVLRELELSGGDVVTPLLAFNLGVEAGQLAIVAIFLLVLGWTFRRAWYVPAMRGGSAVIALVACYWFVERAFLA